MVCITKGHITICETCDWNTRGSTRNYVEKVSRTSLKFSSKHTKQNSNEWISQMIQAWGLNYVFVAWRLNKICKHNISVVQEKIRIHYEEFYVIFLSIHFTHKNMRMRVFEKVHDVM